jgi:hypothetical protein
MNASTRLVLLVVAAVVAGANTQAAELVVVVNPAAPTPSMTELADLYLGKSGGWTPIDQGAGTQIYQEFYRKVTGRNVAQVREIWARILFTGRGLPPKQVPDSTAVKAAVAANPKAVGYIEKSALDATVKVAFPLD